MKLDIDTLLALQENAQAMLFNAFQGGGVCKGQLSDSALAAALASLALERSGRHATARRGRDWLAVHQNADGGWGDTSDSPSNLATTLLTLCALEGHEHAHEQARRARDWLAVRTQGLEPAHIAKAVAEFYGADRTFSAPILSVCAITGLLGSNPHNAWRNVPPLPFEAARLPHSVYRWIHLPVVSYALPALISIGLARHRNHPSSFAPWRRFRDASAPHALRELRRMQPSSGGFLEAIPLTAFVALNLMAANETDCPALGPCLDFLEQSQRPDGAWPIDINLDTWTTSLAARALLLAPQHAMTTDWQRQTRDYLLQTQRREIHPFTQAAPGGWGWTHLPGAVPDADDTSAALLALHALPDAPLDAVCAGIQWLIDLQNSDGGIPTFCRGWANLPFDRSCPDITAHALTAFTVWRHRLPKLAVQLERTIRRATVYLAESQRPDGAWVPLWFGNQKASAHENPVFGTARVLESLTLLPDTALRPLIACAQRWLTEAQNPDGGWGGAPGIPSSIEETALALSALTSLAEPSTLNRGLQFLREHTRNATQFPAVPIGLYFSSLWYSESLYPLIFATQALNRLCRRATQEASPK